MKICLPMIFFIESVSLYRTSHTRTLVKDMKSSIFKQYLNVVWHRIFYSWTVTGNFRISVSFLNQRLDELFHSRTIQCIKSTFAYNSQILYWIYVRRVLGSITYLHMLLCRESLHPFHVWQWAKILLKDPRIVRILLFKLWNNSSSKNIHILWRTHHSCDWLQASSTVITK